MEWAACYKDGSAIKQGQMRHIDLPTEGLAEFSLFDESGHPVIRYYIDDGDRPIFRERVRMDVVSGVETISYIIGKNGKTPMLSHYNPLVSPYSSELPLSDIVLDEKELV